MRLTCVGVSAALAAAVALVPVTAGADPLSASETVAVHTDRADAALARAVELFEANRDRRGARALKVNRAEIGKATVAAAKLLRDADSGAERRTAAKALRLVATTRDDAVETLVAAVEEASGRVDSAIAQAALSDTRGREKALAVLGALTDELPEQAQAGVAKAIAALSTDRAPEARAEAAAIASGAISTRAQRTLAKALEANLDRQVVAAETLRALIASDDVSGSGKAGLRRAYDAVTADHAAAAAAVGEFSDRMPEWARAFVEQVVAQAQEDATQMRENRPEPPNPSTPEPPVEPVQPDETPAGPPADPGRP